MDSTQKAELEKRIKEFEHQTGRVRNLEGGIKKLESGKVHTIAIPVVATEKNLLYSGSDGKYFNVCWFDDEPEIGIEIRNAVVEILQRRLADAKQKRDDS